MINPAPAPEGVLDPQQPWWPTANMRDASWDVLKAKLTGRPMPGGAQYETWVHLSNADADRLIANIKKYGKYPQVNQTGGQGGYENLEAYQKWLVEEFLEKPFRDETNKKIEEAEQNARIEEIRKEAEKNKQKVPLPDINKPKEKSSNDSESEQKELDQDQEVLTKKLDDLTEDIDSMDESPKQSKTSDNSSEQNTTEEDSPEEKEPGESKEASKDVSDIKDSLEQIKGSLKIQAADLTSINQNNASSIASLESLKQLFQSNTDIIRRQAEQAKYQAEQQASSATQDVSGNQQGTDLTADNNATGVIQGIDGDVLTIKTTEGQFQQGQKITQGDGGGGLMGMLKGIAGKFLGGKGGGGGGGGSPLKLSSGGYTTKLADGGSTLEPGVYNKPTRGNLGVNQMAIPLNRNVGKPFKKRDDIKRLRKFDQPLVDVMSQPLKAIGLSILSIAGNFIRALGPLGGFFLPYAKGLVKGFAVILGVPIGLIMSLLGGPAYAASEQQDKQVNIFAKIWDSLISKFGFDIFGGGSDKDKNKKKNDSNDNITAENIDGTTAERAAKVAKQLMSSLSITDYQAAGIVGNLLAESGLEPARVQNTPPGQIGKLVVDGQTGYGYAQWTTAGRQQALWDYAKSKGIDPATQPLTDGVNIGYLTQEFKGPYKSVLSSLKATKSLQEASTVILKDFESPKVQDASVQAVRASKGKAVFDKMSAEEGVQIKVREDSPDLGKFMGWQILDGPPSGYKVSDSLTMHGKEAYLQHENGFSVLPIENNEYSLSKNPIATLDRWKEILGPSGKVQDSATDNSSYESGGKKVFDPKKYQEGTESSKYIEVGKKDKEKSYSLMYKREGATGTYIIKAISKKVSSGGLFSGDNLTSVKINSPEGQSVLNSPKVLEYFKSRTAVSLQTKIKPDPDSDIFYGYNQAFQTTKDAWLKKGLSQKDAEQYAAAAAKEFAVTRKGGSWLPGSRNGADPSLKEVEVASGNTSSDSSSSEKSENDFDAMQKAMKDMIVGAGVMALQPKNKQEYDDTIKKLESSFKVTTPTAQTPGQNTPAAQQTTTPAASRTPTVAAPSPAPVSTGTTHEEITPQQHISRLMEIQYA